MLYRKIGGTPEVGWSLIENNQRDGESNSELPDLPIDLKLPDIGPPRNIL